MKTAQVRIKTWDEMEKEYGVEGKGYFVRIPCPYSLTYHMDRQLPKDRIITITVMGSCNGEYFRWEGYVISEEMIAEYLTNDKPPVHIVTYDRHTIYCGIATREDGKSKLIGFVNGRMDQEALDEFVVRCPQCGGTGEYVTESQARYPSDSEDVTCDMCKGINSKLSSYTFTPLCQARQNADPEYVRELEEKYNG